MKRRTLDFHQYAQEEYRGLSSVTPEQVTQILSLVMPKTPEIEHAKAALELLRECLEGNSGRTDDEGTRRAKEMAVEISRYIDENENVTLNRREKELQAIRENKDDRLELKVEKLYALAKNVKKALSFQKHNRYEQLYEGIKGLTQELWQGFDVDGADDKTRIALARLLQRMEYPDEIAIPVFPESYAQKNGDFHAKWKKHSGAQGEDDLMYASGYEPR